MLEFKALTVEADVILKVATCDLASFNTLLTGELLTAPRSPSSIVIEDLKSATKLALRFML